MQILHVKNVLNFNIFSILSLLFLLMKINNSNIRIDWVKLLNTVFQFLFYLENVFNNIQFHSFSGRILLLCKYFFKLLFWIFKHGYRTIQIIFNKRIITNTCWKNVFGDILVFSQSKRSLKQLSCAKIILFFLQMHLKSISWQQFTDGESKRLLTNIIKQNRTYLVCLLISYLLLDYRDSTAPLSWMVFMRARWPWPFCINYYIDLI